MLSNKLTTALAVLLLATALFGCSGGGELGTDFSSSGGAAGSSTTDVKETISFGPSMSFQNLTGGYNNMGLNPVTHLPAVVYYDKNHATGTTALGALKYAYMDANGVWNIEVVDLNYGTAACGAVGSTCVGAPTNANGPRANILSLKFKSNGTPIIAYIYGASTTAAAAVYKYVKVAERSTAGVWSLSTAASYSAAAGATNVAFAATVDPIKAINLVLDSADRPHIMYAWYAQTPLNNSYLKHLFRNSAGSWTETNGPAIVTGTGTYTALSINQNQIGLAMCSVGGTEYLVGTHALGTNAANSQPAYFQRSVGASGLGGAITDTNLISGCAGACYSAGITAAGNQGIRSDVIINEADDKPVLAWYATATPANTLLAAKAVNDCATAQPATAGSWGALATIDASSGGLNGFKMAYKTADRWLMALLDSTTTVQMTGYDGTNWTNLLTNVETTTVSSEGVDSVYDTTNDIFYMSYAKLPGAAATATGNDIKLAFLDPDDLGAAMNLAVPNVIVDNLVTVFPSTAIPVLSAASTSSGKMGAVYAYQDAANSETKTFYTMKGGSDLDPFFGERNVINYADPTGATAAPGMHPSIAFNSASQPVIAGINMLAAELNVFVARTSNDGASWQFETLNDLATITSVGYTSVATYGTGGVGVSVYDSTGANTALRFYKYYPSSGWRYFVVDGTTGATGTGCSTTSDAGKYSRVRFDSTGRPVIAYQRDGALWLAYATEAITSATYTWTCLNLDASGNTRGTGIDMAIGSGDKLNLVHLDSTQTRYRYVYTSADIATAVTTGASAFSAEEIAAPGPATATDGMIPSIGVNSSGTVYAAFYSMTYQALQLSTRSSGTWTHEYIDTDTSGGAYTSLGGQFPALVINDDGYPSVFFRSRENWLRFFSRESN